MFGNVVLMCWFASTLRDRGVLGIRQTYLPPSAITHFVQSRAVRANGGLSCMGKVRSLRAGCVQSERATARFDTLIDDCNAERVRSK
jgi:hypothetical protein